MNRKSLSSTMSVVACFAALLIPRVTPAATGTHVMPPAKTPPCSAPEYHQFDFFLGDWDGFDVDKPTMLVARNRIERILGGCVVREDYHGVDGFEGQSFSIYDASRKVWHQTWVTNDGKLLVLEGHFRDGQMILSGSDGTAGGTRRLVRGVWKPVRRGVRETAVTSINDGKTWQLWFDMIFRAHSGSKR
jgi:hypothetical protein